MGDVAAAMASAPVTLDRTYTTAMYHNNPLEPHATTALWEPGADVPLTLWDSTQGVHPARAAVAKVFGLDEPRVRVICPFFGGGFGSKGTPHAHVDPRGDGGAGPARPSGEAGADPPADVLPGRVPHPDDPADAARGRSATGDSPPSPSM